MNRRNLLWTLGGIGVAGSAYGWRERRGLRRADVIGEDTGAPGVSPEIRSMLQYALLAPSGHNAQPWTVRVREGELRIGSERQRWLPAVDPANRELALSVGTFLENLLIAAPASGFIAEYAVTGVDAKDGELLRVGLKKTPVAAASLERLRLRRTSRAGQLKRSLSNEDVEGLIGGFADQAHFVSASSREGRYLAQGTIEANIAQAARDDAEQELSEWIRWTGEEGREHRDGLTPESMEITGVAGWYVRHFMDRGAVMGKNFRDQGVDRVREQVGSCGGWIVVTSRDGTLPALIETGRRTERMWLGALERGIGIHPMTQMLEEAGWRDGVAGALGMSGPVQFLLRVGYVDRYPEPTSLRVPVSRILRA